MSESEPEKPSVRAWVGCLVFCALFLVAVAALGQGVVFLLGE